jgi:hypothetical protein
MIGYPERDERWHVPAGDPWWQESWYLAWYDRERGIGGLHRCGHEPNQESGILNLWSAVMTDEGTRFRRSESRLPLAGSDREGDGFGAGSLMRWEVAGSGLRFSARDDGVQIDLTVTNFYPPVGFYAQEGTLHQDFAAHHYESSGRVVGSVELDGVSYAVDGLCHRDHSWGVRKWDTVLSHRWISGTYGPQLSVSTTLWHGVDGSLTRAGCVVRDGEITLADTVDAVTYQETDGVTHRGGEVWLGLPGETLHLRGKPVDGVVNEHRGVACFDTICQSEHDGAPGFLDIESTNNAQDGKEPVKLALAGNLTEGISRRPDRGVFVPAGI